MAQTGPDDPLATSWQWATCAAFLDAFGDALNLPPKSAVVRPRR
jgi:hypothetical protein